MTTAPPPNPGWWGRSMSRIRAFHPHETRRPVTLAGMALRFTVQGDDEAETAEGLQMLLSLGLETKMPPRDMVSNGWMARAVRRDPAADEPEPQT